MSYSKWMYCLMLTLPVFSEAQQMTAADKSMNVQSIQNGSMFRAFDSRAKEVKGNVMLFERYLPGRIFVNQEKLHQPELNYDAYLDQLVVIRNGVEAVVSKAMVTEFHLISGPDTVVFEKLTAEKKDPAYFQRLTKKDHIIAYKKITKVLELPTSSTGGYGSASAVAPELIKRETFYVCESGKNPKEFRNKKTFLQHFPELESELASVIKKEAIDFKDEAGIKKLVVELNQLKQTAGK